MLQRNGIDLKLVAEEVPSSDPRQKTHFANHTYLIEDTRVGRTITFDFLLDGKCIIAQAGTRPQLNKIKSITSSGSHTLELRGDDIYLDNALLRAYTKVLILEMVGAGGGGCGGWLLDNGSGGGAGGYACILLDFTKYSKVDITIGAGGNGIKGASSGPTAANGGDSVIKFNGTDLCRCYGGNGAKGHHGAEGRSATIATGIIEFHFSGFSGAMEEQNSYMEAVSVTGITPFNEPNISYPSRQANGTGNNTGGAGGCSVLAPGGNGHARGNGDNGTLGSGGAGGGAKGSGTVGGRGGDGALNIYY